MLDFSVWVHLEDMSLEVDLFDNIFVILLGGVIWNAFVKEVLLIQSIYTVGKLVEIRAKFLVFKFNFGQVITTVVDL